MPVCLFACPVYTMTVWPSLYVVVIPNTESKCSTVCRGQEVTPSDNSVEQTSVANEEKKKGEHKEEGPLELAFVET